MKNLIIDIFQVLLKSNILFLFKINMLIIKIILDKQLY